MKAKPEQLSKELLGWYQQNKRALPWRRTKDPYTIWISETMLQQTTVTAVIPYFEKFISRFPTVKSLAQAPIDDVLELWSGLGYYSRARNLHKAAQLMSHQGIPKTSDELLQLPGLGPYTSRAVASIAFEEPVGVLDGNVIRVLSRLTGFSEPWWNSQGRKTLQDLSDELARTGSSSEINQALMELGATVCTPQKVLCTLCPWSRHCSALKNRAIDQLPIRKPKKSTELWFWRPVILQKSDEILFTANNYTSFLKKQWIFPGEVTRLKSKPKSYTLEHSITHHKIYIQIDEKPSPDISFKTVKSKFGEARWVPFKEVRKVSPFSLTQKVLDAFLSAHSSPASSLRRSAAKVKNRPSMERTRKQKS
jgi:A/G-specific adenine glycosylase